MNNKFHSLLKGLSQHAIKSCLQHQHAAVILKGGTPVAWGFNSIKGIKTYHAEHAVINKYLSDRGLKVWCRERCFLPKQHVP